MAESIFSYNQGSQDYTGEVLDDILTYTVKENQTYKEGLIHIKPGIQKRYTLPLMQVGQIIQDHKATPDQSVGNVEFTHRHLEPNDFMIYVEFNPRDFEEYYKRFQPTGGLIFRTLDPMVQAKMLREILSKKDCYLDHAIWCAAKGETKAKITANNPEESVLEIGGDDEAGPMKYFDGAIARLLANGAASESSEDAKGGKFIAAGTGTFETGEAVNKELYNMWRAVPKQLRRSPDLQILMDFNTWDIYDQWLSEKSSKYTDNRQENEYRFRGKRIIPMVSFPEHTIIIGKFNGSRTSNLWMGVDYANDENVLVIDKLQANSELYFLKMLLKMDVNIVRPAEIVAHLPYRYAN